MGDTREMSSDIPPQICKTLKQLVSGDNENFEIAYHNPNKKGEGFSGEVIFVTLKDKKTNKELNVIVKQSFRDQAIRDWAPIRDMYMNEIYFYSKVWPTLDKFQEQIPIKYRFQKIPKCLTTASNDDFEYLVIENLKFQNFLNHDKKLPLDKDYYELIFKEYGKFHALSFAYKALHPEEYVDLVEGLTNLYVEIITNETFQKTMKYSYESCIESLQPGVDDAVIEKLQPYLQNYLNLILEIFECKTKYSVITHGDCWSSNMMFKYDESKKVTDVRFLDFQLARPTSPCCDLSYCFYSGASREVLKDLDYYLQIYHDSLSETLKQFGCDSGKLYPLQELKKDWKIFCKFGLNMALMVWKVKFIYDDEVKTATDIENGEFDKMFQGGYDKDGYNKAIKDLVNHFHENGFL
ncbi:uncharacterized protein LOC108907134 [Anoplophora glabripennis]|uniref:uncharacterized protein LOC108907134 n=1 Tax=Anoplophora glabripennis TaxID=217634 RepID=UPI000874E494|nr:uncharacterized protein LOC108907134 [Anoplophora glabripennis]